MKKILLSYRLSVNVVITVRFTLKLLTKLNFAFLEDQRDQTLITLGDSAKKTSNKDKFQ